MILLEMENRVLYETLLAKFQAAKPESVNVAAVDFDGVYYMIRLSYLIEFFKHRMVSNLLIFTFTKTLSVTLRVIRV